MQKFIRTNSSQGWSGIVDWRPRFDGWVEMEKEKNPSPSATTTKAGTKTATSFDVDTAVAKALERSYGK